MAYVIVCLLIAHGGQRMRDDEPMLIQCWHSVQAVDSIYISAMMQMNALIRSEK